MDIESPSVRPESLPGPVNFPVVGIGASAGGFPALTTLLLGLPPDPGMALVVILHLAAHEPSAADRVLQRATRMPVVQVMHTTRILPGKVYVIPPDRSLTMQDGHLVLGDLERSRGRPVAIDTFLCTLAQAHGERAVGVVLSGMGSDGSAGLACIKQMGGVTIVQSPDNAEHGAMPRAAIESGAADFVLPAADIPRKLVELRDTARRIRARGDEGGPGKAALPGAALMEVLSALQARTGYDFTHYRLPTLTRRIERRMQVRGIGELAAYARLLREHPQEAQSLAKDLLIGVTRFFRDPEAFEALERKVLPGLLAALPPGQPLRAWVAACASGEEAYSLAMLLADRMGEQPAFQVFASDVDEQAVRLAQAGAYPASIAQHVTPQRLQRYFTLDAGHYRVRKSLRERMLFTRHDLLQDPVFTRLDLVSCRNLLIYLKPHMHRALLQQFHFALNPGGFLLLGGAESVEAAPDLFMPVDAENRIFQARPAARTTARTPAAAATAPADAGPLPEPRAGRRGRLYSFADIHLHKAAELAPPSILVDANAEVLHVSEEAARFLQTTGGEPTRELAALLLPELQLPLRAALFQSRHGACAASSGVVRYERDGVSCTVDLQLLPFEDEHAEGRLILVRFVEHTEAPPLSIGQAPQDGRLAQQLDEELAQTRRQLQDTVDQAVRAGNEMRIYQEEMQSSIEELRVHGEELERRGELLRSANQELEAGNRALRKSADASAKAHDDLANLIASSDVATIFLDRAMRIVRFTPRISDFFNVIEADVGRPLAHITNRLDYPRLAEDAAQVFVTLQAMEREVRDRRGRDYIVRVHPYRTGEDRIEGAVMTFFDISSHRAAEAARRELETRFGSFAAAVSDSLYRMSADWSEMFDLKGMGFLSDTGAPSRTWLEDYIPPDEQPLVRAAILDAIARKGIFELEHRVLRADGSIGWTFSRAVPMLDEGGAIVEWFGAAADVSERKRIEELQRENDARLAALFDGMPVGVGVFDVEGKVTISNQALARYLPTGRRPSSDPERLGRWRSWGADGELLGPHDFPGERALRGEQVVPGVEMLYTDDEGREIWTQVAALPLRDAGGEVVGQSVVITDIDALKRSEEALRENERRLRELAGEFAQMMWETRPDGMVAADSPSWRAYTGQTLDQWLGTGWLDAVHPDDRAFAARQWREAVGTHGMVDAQFRIRRADGQWRLMKVRAAPLFGADGRIRKWVGLNVDIGGD